MQFLAFYKAEDIISWTKKMYKTESNYWYEAEI